MANIKIYVACHKKFFIPDGNYFVPIELGAKQREKHFYPILDSTGENISDYNKCLCELTGVYWAWKNSDADYFGLCHYRRYFSFEHINKKSLDNPLETFTGDTVERFDTQTLNKINPLPGTIQNFVSKYDIILPKPTKLPMSAYEQFISCPQHGSEDVMAILNICDELNPEFKKYVIKAFESNVLYPFNMFIMKKKYFNAYCKTMFPILKKYVDKYLKANSIYAARKAGMLSERMMYAFLLMQKELNKDLKFTELEVIQINDPINVPLEPISTSKNCILINGVFRDINDVLFSLISIKDCAKSTKNFDVVILTRNKTDFENHINSTDLLTDDFKVRYWNIGLPFDEPNIPEIVSQFKNYNKILYVCGRLHFVKDPSSYFSCDLNGKLVAASLHINPLDYLSYQSSLKSFPILFDNSLFVVDVKKACSSVTNALNLTKLILHADKCEYGSDIDFIEKLDYKYNFISYHFSIQKEILLNLIPASESPAYNAALADPTCINYNFIVLESPVKFYKYDIFNKFYKNLLPCGTQIIYQEKPKTKLRDKIFPKGTRRREFAKRVVKKEKPSSLQMDMKPKYNLENKMSITVYHKWLKNEKFVRTVKNDILFSVIIPVYNVKSDQLIACIESVLNQTYQNFELILVDDCSTQKNVREVLSKYKDNKKIIIKFKEKNGGISDTTNVCLSLAKGEFIVFMDCDDTLDEHALNEVANYLHDHPDTDFVYSDEDKITEDGTIRHLPFFKPDWSPDLFMSMMYTNHLGVYRKSVIDQTGGELTKYDGAQDYDFTIRFMEHSDNKRVGHIAKVLYHWRERKESIASSSSAKSYGVDLARLAREDYCKRNHIDATFKYLPKLKQDVIIYGVKDNPLVSIIIPSKDNVFSLNKTISSLKKYTNYKNYEIIVVDNGSNKLNSMDIKFLLEKNNVKYIYEKFDFNFSKMCNIGAKAAKGDYLVFLNDDIEIYEPTWLDTMIGHAQQKHVGCVGCKLLFSNTTMIQHAGVSSRDIGPCHEFYKFNEQGISYFGFDKLSINSLIVTGACLAISKKIFDEVDGFDENFPTEYNDVDLCMKVYKAGYYNVCRNDFFLYHHEGLTREKDVSKETKAKAITNYKKKLYKKHPEFNGYDPFLNINMIAYSDVLMLKNINSKFTEKILTFLNKHQKLKRFLKKILKRNNR